MARKSSEFRVQSSARKKKDDKSPSLKSAKKKESESEATGDASLNSELRTPNSIPKVAIIGRPNVGKSTLFNRLTGTRHALVADTPGVTRDRREGDATIADLKFTLIDTAGLEEAEENSLSARMTAQTMSAIKDADIILMMVDGRAGLLPTDKHFAGLVRQSGKPVILAVNKSEGRSAMGAGEAYALGFDMMVAISAEHGEGMGALYDAFLQYFDGPEQPVEKKRRKKKSEMEELPDDATLLAEAQAAKANPINIAVVGRPNVGKSTFINRLLGEDRVLTGPEAGITRDAIAIPFTYQGHALKLVDTAGMRKKAKVVQDKLEVMAVNDTRRAIQFAQIVVLMVDATQPLDKQDNQIAAMIADEGRACVFALNKWDLIPHNERGAVLEEVRFQTGRIMPYFRDLPIVALSAERGNAIDQVITACLKIYDVWNHHVATAELNRWLHDALQTHTPPLVDGKRLKIKYMTQAKTRPPTFALFTNRAVPESYKRYLVNAMRDAFGLPGVPIRLLIRKGKNPYSEESN
jgi:GTP-binding protein